MTDVAKPTARTAKKTIKKTEAKPKSDETLLKDAKERIMRLQKKSKPKQGGKAKPKTDVKTKKTTSSRGVVYLGHIPDGFFEEELRGYFNQFGKVLRVKVSRSSKTGRSKGYAFVEFADDEVAKIVAETMNNYLMFERLVKAQYIPPEKVHPRLFPKRWITPDCYPTLVRRKQLKKKQENPATEEDKQKHRKRIDAKLKKSISFLNSLGIDYAPVIYDPDYVPDPETEPGPKPAEPSPKKTPEPSKSQSAKSPANETPKSEQKKGAKKQPAKTAPVAAEPVDSPPAAPRAGRVTRQSIVNVKTVTTEAAGQKASLSNKRASLASPSVGRKKKTV